MGAVTRQTAEAVESDGIAEVERALSGPGAEAAADRYVPHEQQQRRAIRDQLLYEYRSGRIDVREVVWNEAQTRAERDVDTVEGEEGVELMCLLEIGVIMHCIRNGGRCFGVFS